MRLNALETSAAPAACSRLAALMSAMLAPTRSTADLISDAPVWPKRDAPCSKIGVQGSVWPVKRTGRSIGVIHVVMERRHHVADMGARGRNQRSGQLRQFFRGVEPHRSLGRPNAKISVLGVGGIKLRHELWVRFELTRPVPHHGSTLSRHKKGRARLVDCTDYRHETRRRDTKLRRLNGDRQCAKSSARSQIETVLHHRERAGPLTMPGSLTARDRYF